MDAVREVLARYEPHRGVATVTALGEGQENRAYEVDGELVVRFSKARTSEQRAAAVEREAQLLAMVAEASPLPVPAPAFAAPEHGCIAYPKLAGRPLLEASPERRAAAATTIAPALGGFLAAIDTALIAAVRDLAAVDDQPLERWRDEAAGLYAAISSEIPEGDRRGVEEVFAAPPPPRGGTRVFSHNDLGIEHVLVDPSVSTVTGVIDWSDAAIVDPAYDLGLILRDLGPTALDATLDAYGSSADVALRERARFYARCSVIEDLAYGLDNDAAAYVEKSRGALAWLFPAGGG